MKQSPRCREADMLVNCILGICLYEGCIAQSTHLLVTIVGGRGEGGPAVAVGWVFHLSHFSLSHQANV